jgi:polyhydroxyalkanoate synthase
MSDDKSDKTPGDQMADFFAQMTQMAVEGQKAWAGWMAQASGMAADAQPDMANMMKPPDAMADAMATMRANPGALMAAQTELWNGYQALFMQTTQKLMGNGVEAEPVAKPAPGDRRFKDPDWDDNAIFSFVKQSYLLNAEWLKKLLDAVEGVDTETARKIDFYGRQVIDAMAPTNFALTNPTVLRETLETKGENLTRGMNNLMADIQQGNGQPSIRQTDMTAFEVGKNIAVSPGKVVFQNEMLQLIHYAPLTEQVFARPLLIIPPWINKFYILDLQPDNSMVRWLSEQGYTVFLISWVNPDERYRDKKFDDYMTDGILAAVDAIEAATGMKEITALGYCIGGTLLSATLAWMQAQGDTRIKAATFLTAQVDFTEAGELRVFTDETQVAALEKQVAEKGYLDGGAMAWTFNMLRANDLIWSFVINNYLMGKDPPAFDLLYWNADSTRMPATMLSFYLRNMYLENKLAQPGGIELGGVPIDLTTIETPVFFQATREDHIAPYPSVYKAMNLFGGPRRFVLAGSGHIAGVVNPPAKGKYQHWVNEGRKQYATADEWLADAAEHPGSWWPYWHKWLGAKSGKKVPARIPGDGKLKAIEDAPGSYVLVRS